MRGHATINKQKKQAIADDQWNDDFGNPARKKFKPDTSRLGKQEKDLQEELKQEEFRNQQTPVMFGQDFTHQMDEDEQRKKRAQNMQQFGTSGI